MRKKGVQPKVVSDILGHQKVNLAMDVYDRTDTSDFAQALGVIAAGWYQVVSNRQRSPENLSTVADLVGPPGFQDSNLEPTDYEFDTNEKSMSYTE